MHFVDRYKEDEREDGSRRAEEGADQQLAKKKKAGLFSKPSCVLLLKNMVSYLEAEAESLEQLADETQAECLKYGPVRTCLVRTLPTVMERLEVPDCERVRTFVQFERQDSAVRVRALRHCIESR